MYAVIDIGSNSVRLMYHDGVKTLSKRIITTQLAEGLSKTSTLKFEAVERTARAVSFFVEESLKSVDKNNLYVFATAAVRQAENGKMFTERVKELCDIDVDVISGENEAKLGILGALGGQDGGIIDIGGASTEIVVINNKKQIYCKSLNIGAVRLKDLCGQNQYKTEIETANIISGFGEIPKVEYYGIGGTITTVSAMIQDLKVYDSNKTDGFKIKVEDVCMLKNKLFSMTVEERKKLNGLQEKRAEIIAHGVSILYEIMNKFNIDYVITSESDNLEGYLKFKREINE